jgi:magnesium chelatase family protein
VTPVPFEKLSDDQKRSVDIRKSDWQEIQTVRFEQMDHIHYNAQMNTTHSGILRLG